MDVDWEDDYNQALLDAGGLGKLQLLATCCLMVIRLTGNSFNYGFTFLVMNQFYSCRFSPDDTMTSCATD
jgi:hypothetical protein